MARFINPKIDLHFKKIFGSVQSKNILVSFLNAVIYAGKPMIDSVTIINPYIPGETKNEKATYVDIQAILISDEIILIEMQMAMVKAFAKRILYNLGKRYGTQLRPSQYYDRAVPVIGIVVTNFDFLKERNDPLSHFIFREENSGERYPAYEDLHFYVLELPKFRKRIEQIISPLDEWFYFMNELDQLEEIPDVMAKDPAMKEAFQIADELNLIPSEKDILERAERDAMGYDLTLEWQREESKKAGREEGIREGIKEGREVGREEGREEIRGEATQVMRATIYTILSTRFGEVPIELSRKLSRIDDFKKLGSLIEAASFVDSLEAFELE